MRISRSATKSARCAARSEIKTKNADHLAQQTTEKWLAILQPADVWCASVLRWPDLLAGEGFKVLDMLQTVTRPDDLRIATTRAPLRIDGIRPVTARAAPRIGEHTAALRREFDL
jgi:CoA:oxalate CoA-transferase